MVGGKGRWGGEKGKVRTNTLSRMGAHYLSSLVPRHLCPFFLGWDGSGLGPKVYLDDHVLGPLCEVPLLLHLLILVLR